jgi:hypothetical protein
MADAMVGQHACLTSVHPSETKPHPLEVQSHAQHRLHAGVKESRRQVIDAFLASNKPAMIKRAGKLGMCGVSPVIRLERGRRPALCPGRCRDRLCPLCSRLRGQQVRFRIRALVQKANSVRFVTLTMKASEETLGERIDAILKAFSDLRRRAFWKERCRGGLFVVETTRGRKGEHWHVHLHVLVEGDYMAQAALKAEWASVTGGSSIVDIRATHSREKAVNYVCKYVSKGSEVSEWDAETICEYAEGVHRRRLMGTFGKWHSIDVNEDRDTEEPDELPRHGTTWAKLKAAIDSGTLDRNETLAALWQLGYIWRLLIAEEFEEPPEVTVVPGARVYDAMTVAMLDIEGVPEREQGPPPPIQTKRPDGQRGLWCDTKYM